MEILNARPLTVVTSNGLHSKQILEWHSHRAAYLEKEQRFLNEFKNKFEDLAGIVNTAVEAGGHKMNLDKEQIKSVLERAQKLEKTIPRWVYRVEQINQQQYERTKQLAYSELEKEQKPVVPTERR